MQEDIFWLGFSAFPGIGPKRFRLLLEQFESAGSAWGATANELQEVVGEAITAKFLAFKRQFSLEKYAEQVARRSISYLLLEDESYPSLLKQLPNAPFVLYVKGDLNLVASLGGELEPHPLPRFSRKLLQLANPSSVPLLRGEGKTAKSEKTEANKTIAIVGTRKVTQYGMDVTKMLTRELVENNFVIVSGLAIGVDSIAHTAATEANGKTIAVLGCGVDCCTPGTNQPLYDKIVRHFGAVVSESAFGAGAMKGIFPARNRIIAGLSVGVVVTEGTEDSGALITAARAKELGRPIFAVPGPITSQLSSGPNILVKSGAKMITGAEDILKDLGMHSDIISKQQLPVGENETEQQIISLLADEQLHFNDIARMTRKNAGEIAGILSMMEVKGIVKSGDGGIYTLNQK